MFDARNANSTALIASTLITASIFSHVTAVYHATLMRQEIYVNGQLDARSLGTVAPYQGVTAGSAATIDRTASPLELQYFNG